MDENTQNSHFKLTLGHLYGNLLNTYGDNGNLLMLKYLGEKLGATIKIQLISIDDIFEENAYDLIFFGGGQDYEQRIVSKDIQEKKAAIIRYIENNGVLLAICGGYQLLGHYYIEACDRRVEGIGALDHYTLNQQNHRFIGDVEIISQKTNEHFYGFENHQGRTFLGGGEQPLGIVVKGHGNNGEDKSEGVIYKNVYGSYFHGPLLARNPHLAYQLLSLAIKQKYEGEEIKLPAWKEMKEFIS
ncbi:MAG: adenosylcobyric acid synthase [Streptococcaceae bacterium]|jgi:CobQ-like glutamine amidotransferase family enzyme|nr:adenosylcobyric acid synthase [Streptococcaceae bacterium]